MCVRRAACDAQRPTRSRRPFVGKLTARWERGVSSARQLWLRLFRSYGTHYVDQLVLGGKMIFSKYINTTSVSAAKKAGHSVAQQAGIAIKSETEAGGGLFGIGGKGEAARENSIENSFRKSYDQLNEFQQAVADSASSTIVMGGTPPGKGAMSTGGFAEWANSVTLNPVPIKYELIPLSELGEAVVRSGAVSGPRRDVPKTGFANERILSRTK